MLKCKGFTLVELLVSIFIIILMSGIIFANYRVGGQQFALQRSANKLAQDIRRAQQMAMGASEFCPTPPCPPNPTQTSPGYGIILDKVWGIKKYRLYADTNGNNEFFNPNDPLVEDPIDLESGVIIKEISSPSTSYNSVSINFASPDPTVNIKFNVDPGGQPKTIITLALATDPNKTKTVEVNKAGLIEIK